jgi:ferredoxin--NADP+ reductase
MPHAVTQSCVGDGSCVYACPVNCIQPTPDDPAFELAEMLFIDPSTCVDCGACVTACPVDAIKPHSELDATEHEFLAINAAFHHERRALIAQRPSLAPVRPVLRVVDRGEPIRIAIVGSGPAAMYAADEILTIPGAEVDVYERLHQPYGLVRSGVAPDHRRTRRITRQLELVRHHPRLRMHLGVEVGRHIAHDALTASHHAVIYAVGSITDRALALPGAQLPGVCSATSFVGWYNGHPDLADRTFDLSHRRAVVVGNGNVALDVARLLTVDPASLSDTDIAPRALRALHESAVEEVVVIGRRGPEHAAFTLPELVGVTATPGVEVTVNAAAFSGDYEPSAKLALLRSLPTAPTGRGRHIRLCFGAEPERIVGGTRAEGITVRPSARLGVPSAGEPVTLATGLVLSAIGYRGTAVASLPFDDHTGTVPNVQGRVVDPATEQTVAGTYVVGWIKRGTNGFIGTNKRCAQDTVAALIDDYNAGRLSHPAAPATG